MNPSSLALLLSLTLASAASRPPATVEAALKPEGPWKPYPTRTLEDLPAAATAKPDSGFSQYGGLLSRKVKATGFFYPTKVEGRWWLVDPEGCLFLHKGVASVSLLRTPGAEAAWCEKFSGLTYWAPRTTALLREYGFNGLGAWSDTERLREVSPPLVYTRIWNFMSSYGKRRGGTYQQPGHTGYPNDCIFVFDPGFETFCDEQAKQLAGTKDDPWLLGHFSDNELPLNRTALKKYLGLPAKDYGYEAAWVWLRSRHGQKASLKDVTEQDEQDFLALVVDRYCRIVSKAIKKYDPNHLYLGARFHGAVPRLPEVFRAAGPHVDVISVNLYHVWTPDLERFAMWERESGRPFLITEWYAKGMDSGLANTTGAGWSVKTQRDRGRFYQNFTLGLLASKACVGWDWFKYIDNDPAAKNVDPSNVDSNKGILSNRYVPYLPLLEAMKSLNQHAYSLADYL
ncbi:MAG TPA: hypothetical protein VNZ22_03715, partial [Bacillota bacterium]|nr:hypothetical protein [Bacillota bacterium]